MENLTYAESKNEKPFDWKAKLESIIDNEGSIGYDEHLKLSKMAGEWVTCACGNTCAIIPRGVDGSPKDGRLHALGVSFYTKIYCYQWTAALGLLDQIEDRAAKLINETIKS